MSGKNIELMRQVLAEIEAHPETWDQTRWRCGTAMCFAGHAAMLAGAEWEAPQADNDPYVKAGDGFITVNRFASDALGLNRHEADLLFAASNTLNNLKYIVDAFERDEDIFKIADNIYPEFR